MSPDIATSGEQPMTTDYETLPESLCIKSGDGFEQDMLVDDLSVFIRTHLGLVVATGCAHRGIVNVITHGMEIMDERRLYMIIGGTHLITADDDRITRTIEALRGFDPSWIGVSHCTGFQAAAKLYSAFPDRFFANFTGSVIEFPFKG